MTEYELSAFHSEFDPVRMSESLKQDSSPKNKARQFAVLKTAFFLVMADPAGHLSVLSSKANSGETLLAAFTSREELEKRPFPKGDVREMPFSALERMVKESPRLDGVVINPFGQALLLRRAHLADMDNVLRAAVPRRELKMKATLDYPIGLPMAVRELMEKHPEVYRVWLMAAHSESEHTDHKLFVVDFDGEREPLFPLLVNAVRLYLREGEACEIVKADIQLLRICEEAAKPIYVKKD